MNYEKFYLEYCNNFLTVAKFAEYYNFSIKQAEDIINKGKAENIFLSYCKENSLNPDNHNWLLVKNEFGVLMCEITKGLYKLIPLN